jgi:hypothetical protein
MANVDRPNGAQLVNTLSAAAFNAATKVYEADASAGNIFPGDFVILEADGKVAPATAGATEIVGVCIGVLPWMPNKVNGVSGHNISTDNINLMLKYHATGAAGMILVHSDPDAIYEMQEDGDTSDLALTDIGTNVDILATAGSTTTGLSQQEIDSSSATTATAQLRVLGMVDRPDNELGDWARWLVKINESHFTKLTGV